MVLPRLEHGWNAFPAIKDTLPQPPSTYARKLYYDTLVYDPLALKYIIERFGLSQIMIGTDYPFAIADFDPHASLAAAGLGAEARSCCAKAMRGAISGCRRRNAGPSDAKTGPARPAFFVSNYS